MREISSCRLLIYPARMSATRLLMWIKVPTAPNFFRHVSLGLHTGVASAASPDAPFLGLLEHLIGRLHGLETPRGFGVAGGRVRMVCLGEAPIGRLDFLEAGVGLDLEQFERTHLLA